MLSVHLFINTIEFDCIAQVGMELVSMQDGGKGGARRCYGVAKGQIEGCSGMDWLINWVNDSTMLYGLAIDAVFRFLKVIKMEIAGWVWLGVTVVIGIQWVSINKVTCKRQNWVCQVSMTPQQYTPVRRIGP